MKNLILSAMVAALASQAAGCIIVSDDSNPTGNRVAFSWTYKINGVAQPGCPVGANGVNLMIKPTTGGAAMLSQFSCRDTTMIEYVPDGSYQIWAELVLNNQPYARSLAVEQQLIGVDTDISADIHEDRGYFQVAWSLKGITSNSLLGCTQVPTLASIGMITTKVGTTTLVDSKFECGPGSGFSRALEMGGHSVKIDALKADNLPVGAGDGVPVLTNRQIADRNQITNLGSVVIPIPGL